MFGLIIAIILFNIVAFSLVKRLTKSQMVHMWLFTAFFHLIVDLYLGFKYEGYWYFNQGMEWLDLPAILLLSPPAILLFLDRYPFHELLLKRFFYIVGWSLIIVVYEAISLLPEPWGFFHYGWWKLVYSAILYPLLFSIALFYYKWIGRIEEKEKE
ncbi:hypothetical protein [Oceanobacillus halophilus]|uniref:Uncharacterized protein n=1 Tax=Oceanobacillus halophilus TaxID=930130 RepID=A0A494ZV16_9BACI|nr:hypothetical protein [Oceanobacillus halophilus]RKQ30251.1 hypothetical protein D8M06_16300 [Oceanobacillus halophilus]